MKMERREIEKEMVIETLEDPDNILEGHTKTKLVITCYLTSQIERYKEEGKDESDV
ncbi:MAG: hypothetical protein ACLFNY_06825 [Candidatus Aenigmatarchaeota archaeon]